MNALEARNRIRQTFIALEGASDADRDAKLRATLKGIFQRTPAEDRQALLRSLSAEFPVWPPDVPPPPPPTDQEMVEKLRMRMDASPGDRRRIEALLRDMELGSGLKEEDIRRLRERLMLEAGTAQPEVGRVVEALLVLVQSMAEIDSTLRGFLQQSGLGMMFVGVPRLKDTVGRLATLPDNDPARHARQTELENTCLKLRQAVALLAAWPETFADEAANRIAPKAIEAQVPGKFLGTNYEGFWNEYVTRLGGRKDEAQVKAELLKMMQEAMRETVGT